MYTVVLLGISGVLAIVSEGKPRKVPLKACLACTLLSAVITGIQLIVYLVDLNKFKRHKFYCPLNEIDRQCFRLAEKERTLFAFVPAFYLLTLCGMILCIVLSISLCEFLHSWKPELNQPVVAPVPPDAEGAALISRDVPPEEPRQTPATGPRDQRRPKDVTPGKRSLLLLKFLEVQPKLLGVVHLVLGLCMITITVAYLVSQMRDPIRLGFIWWLEVQCLVSGVLSIVAEDRPTINMIRTCMALNIVSAIVAIINVFVFLETAGTLMTCAYIECEDTLVIVVSLFPMLFILLEVIISVVITAYARKSLRSLSLSKTTLVLRPPAAQDPPGDPWGSQ
ncbi:high affinity immunoglobulin epsilon receptor subunit beta-like isoform X2 [Heterodontus francisci]